MTELLQEAIAQIQKLPDDRQDAIAARILEELADERAWEERFDSTTDAQWSKLASMARQEIRSGDVTSVDDVFF